MKSKSQWGPAFCPQTDTWKQVMLQMPTAGGLLKKGDEIRHKESGQVLTVLTRLGNRRADYSVRVRKPDGSKFVSNDQYTFVIAEADWWLNKSGKWELCEEPS